MKNKFNIFAAFLIFPVLLSGLFSKTEYQYIGSNKCKTCHNSQSAGQQYKIWTDSNHSQAYEILNSKKAVLKANNLNINDPLKSDKCLSCHAPGYGKKNTEDSFNFDEGVGCEICHGPGSDYKKMNIMKDRKKAMAAGLIIPSKDICTACHIKNNPEHSKNDFNYEKEWKKIAHPIPK